MVPQAHEIVSSVAPKRTQPNKALHLTAYNSLRAYGALASGSR
jgi:hypothetical protein